MKLVKEYTLFRKNYKFDYEKLEKTEGKILFRGEIVEASDGTRSFGGENYVNISYSSRFNSLARALSNLYPISFKFRGKKVNSIEGVLQGIKYKDKKMQNLVLKYSGADAYHTRGANSLDFWGNSGKLYWQGKEIARDSEEYQSFLDELYISAIKNPIYKNSLIATENKYLLHHIGRDNPNETVLTRYEYEERLHSLREFVKLKNL